MTQPDTARPWWQSAAVYQIYPRSFADSTGDGVGDLTGLIDRLDHLVDLGVDAVWLSPIFASPMADFGYDVADYCDVDPLFGSLATADALIAAAHERGVKVILDWVPNHTSDQHPWFVAARSSRDNPYRDFYVWRDGPPDTPPNNWRAAFAQAPTWTYDRHTEQWYLHCFLPEQPDLNWDNPAVEAAMHDVLRFWLDRGVDGFRADVVHLIGKDPALPPVDDALTTVPYCVLNDFPTTHERLRRLRALLDGYDGDRMMVGEVYLLDTAQMATYYGHGDELNLSFNFPPLWSKWDADAWRGHIDTTLGHCAERGAWPTWVLSNHDVPRHRTRYGSLARARAAAVLLLGLPGTPFLFAGEELGLSDAIVPPDRVVDPGGRDGCRAPMPWDATTGHGWTDPWLPFAPEADEGGDVASQTADPDSTLSLYRRLLAVRRPSRAMCEGGFDWVESPTGVLVWDRVSDDGDRARIAVNFTSEIVDLEFDGDWRVTADSVSPAVHGAPFRGTLGPDQALVLTPN